MYIKNSEMDISEEFKRDGVNVSKAVEQNNHAVIFDIINLLHLNGELNSKEHEGFIYAFEVLRDEFQNVDHSDFDEQRKREIKNNFSQSKLDFFLKGYSRVISSYPAAIGLFAATGVNASYMMMAAPLVLTPVFAGVTNYQDYTKSKKYGAERMVKDYLGKKNVGVNFMFHGKEFGRMDAYRRKIEAFKGSVSKRYDMTKDEDGLFLKHLKKSVMFLGRCLFDAVTFNSSGRHINKKLRKVERIFEKHGFSNNSKVELYERASNEMYNEYLSSCIERYLNELVFERLNIEKEILKIAKKSDDLNYYLIGEYKGLENALKKNKKEIKKISTLRGFEHANNRDGSVYYAGASIMAERVLMEIDRNENRVEDQRDIYGATKLMKDYKREMDLEKKKALLRIKAPDFMNSIGLNKNNNKHIILFGKCMSVLMSGELDIEDSKQRIAEMIEFEIKDVEKRVELKIRYSDFAEDFIRSYQTYKSKDFTLDGYKNKSGKEKLEMQKNACKFIDDIVVGKLSSLTKDKAKENKYKRR